MAVPRNRLSNSRKNKRRSHMAKKPKNTISCQNCKALILSHRICPSCGYYANKVVNATEEKK